MARKPVLEPDMATGMGWVHAAVVILLLRTAVRSLYGVQPWSAKIITVWIVGYLIELVIIGALVALIYRPKAAAV